MPPMWPWLRHPRRLHCRASASEPLAGWRDFVGTLSLLLLSLLSLLALPFLLLSMRHPRRLHCHASATDPLGVWPAFVGFLSL